MRTSILKAGCLLLALAINHLPVHGLGPAPRAKPKTRQELMKRKLELSQQLLASLTLNDLARAGTQAEELLRVRKDPAWRVLKTDLYEGLSADFTRAAEGIVKASKDRNAEAAKLHYLGMTLSCFNCHTYYRDRKADAE